MIARYACRKFKLSDRDSETAMASLTVSMNDEIDMLKDCFSYYFPFGHKVTSEQIKELIENRILSRKASYINSKTERQILTPIVKAYLELLLPLENFKNWFYISAFKF